MAVFPKFVFVWDIYACNNNYKVPENDGNDNKNRYILHILYSSKQVLNLSIVQYF